MKSQIKPLSLLAGAIALSLSLASALPAFSQSTEKPATPTEQPTENRMPHPRNFLNLTSDQQTQMEQIHQNERSQIDNILTTEQKAQLETARANRGAPGQGADRGMRGMRGRGFDSLNLTDEQRSQIESVRSTAKEQMDAVLTDEQRQQIEQHRQEHQERRQANPPQGTQSR
jgi:Spy/CpxP family protein refolding chaperone